MADKGPEDWLKGKAYIDTSGTDSGARDRSNYTIREHIEHIQSNMGSLNTIAKMGPARYLQKRRYLEEIRYYKQFDPNMLFRDAPSPGEKS